MKKTSQRLDDVLASGHIYRLHLQPTEHSVPTFPAFDVQLVIQITVSPTRGVHDDCFAGLGVAQMDHTNIWNFRFSRIGNDNWNDVVLSTRNL